MGDIEMPIEKRWLLRRAVAFVIDWIIVSLGVLIVVFALQVATGLSFKTTEIVTLKSCRNIDIVPAETLRSFGIDLSKAQHIQQVCKHSNLGLAHYYKTTIEIQRFVNGATETKGIYYNSDSEGKPAPVIPLDWIVPLLAPLLFAFQLSLKKSTYGKLIMSLDVVTTEDSTPTLWAALRRELLKFSPLIILALFDLGSTLSWLNGWDPEIPTVAQIVEEVAPLIAESTDNSLDQPLVFAWFTFPNLLALAALIFYLASFIRWRGQTYWDQFAGLKVTSTWDQTEASA